MPVGSVVIAAFSDKRARPSLLREREIAGMLIKTRITRRIGMSLRGIGSIVDVLSFESKRVSVFVGSLKGGFWQQGVAAERKL